MWLLVQPRWLYGRFFIWALPGVAWLVGSACARFRWLAVPVLVASLVSAVRVLPGPANDLMPLKQAAQIIRHDQLAGRHPCALDFSGTPLVAYLPYFVDVTRPSDLATCDSAYWLDGATTPKMVSAAEQAYPGRLRLLGAQFTGMVFYRGPVPGS
jgi:hypothetical protein